MIARIATGWSRVEERLGSIVVRLLQAEAHTGMKMYQALTSSASQRAVLRAVARDRLNQEMMDRLEALLSEHKVAARKRNKVVHGHWYVSDDHPNELVWTDAADELLGYSEFSSGWSASADMTAKMAFAQRFSREPKRLLYNEQEFEEILSEFIDVANALTLFNMEIAKLNELSGDEAGLGSA